MMFRASPFNAAMLIIVQITRTVSGSHCFDTNSGDTFLYINRTDFISSMKGIHRWAVTRSLPPGPRLSRVYEYNKNKLLRYSYLGYSGGYSGFSVIFGTRVGIGLSCFMAGSGIAFLFKFGRNLTM